MHSSWYSRRAIEALGAETSSDAADGAIVANRRMFGGCLHVEEGLRSALKLRELCCMPHVGVGVVCRSIGAICYKGSPFSGPNPRMGHS